MTEATTSEITPDQNAQRMEDNFCDIKPGQNMQETESIVSETCPGPKGQTAEIDEIPDQKSQLTDTSSSDMTPDLKGTLIYRCKKCRQIVASEENLVSHEQGDGEASFRGRKKSVEPNAPECTAIFVEPLKWMLPVQEGYISEKLYCIGCKSKLGFFTWIGMQCSCGAWVRPAFQIIKSRVDECRI
ncbi:hypothetical protein RND81_07G150900 [Saponaria officinalis]|uniref:Inactive dual specificity protein phosphatase-like n=1 Tax=Saponaria officinalis TaxID=3572 RepID=A0AAW1JSQ3_SAPOF